MQQVGNLPAGIGKFELSPWTALAAAALSAWLPLPVVIFEERRAAGRTDRLRHGSKRQHKFSETAAIDVSDVFQIDQYARVSFGDLIADRITESRDRVACGNFPGQ